MFLDELIHVEGIVFLLVFFCLLLLLATVKNFPEVLSHFEIIIFKYSFLMSKREPPPMAEGQDDLDAKRQLPH